MLKIPHPNQHKNPPNPVSNVPADPDSYPSLSDSYSSDSSDSSDDKYYKRWQLKKNNKRSAGVKLVSTNLSKISQSLQPSYLQPLKNQRS